MLRFWPRNFVLGCVLAQLLFTVSTFAEVKSMPSPRGPVPIVAFVAPGSAQNTYWKHVYQIFGSVASDLGFQFVPHNTGVEDRFLMVEEARRVLEAKRPPDFLVLAVNRGTAEPLLKIAERVKVPVVLLGPLFPEEIKVLGKPCDRLSPIFKNLFA